MVGESVLIDRLAHSAKGIPDRNNRKPTGVREGRRSGRTAHGSRGQVAGGCHAAPHPTAAAYDAPGLPAGDKAIIQALITSIVSDDEKVRHGIWLEQIRKGTFSFGAEEVSYDEAEWQADAMGGEVEGGFLYADAFLACINPVTWLLKRGAMPDPFRSKPTPVVMSAQ